MEPIQHELLQALADIDPRPSRIPFISTVTGAVVAGQKLSARYWWRNVRCPVLFGPAISKLIRGGDRLFLEIGPHPALLSSVNQSLSDQGVKGGVFHSLRRQTDESQQLLSNLGGLHAHGVAVDWAAVNQSAANFVRFPSYCWNRESYWFNTDEVRLSWLAPDTHVLLGRRITATKPTWELELDPRLFPYLNDHRFWDRIVFPAAGYGEMGIALARELFPGEPHAVEELDIKSALFVSEDKSPIVRVVFQDADKSLSVYSAPDNREEWTLHAQARLTPLATAEPPAIDLAAIRERLPESIDHERYYAEFAAAGYQFGPRFQHVENVWRRRGGVSQDRRPDDVVKTVGHYHFHPAVLDACFHIFKGVQDIPADAAPEDTSTYPLTFAVFGRIATNRRRGSGPTPVWFWMTASHWSRISTSTTNVATGSPTSWGFARIA